MCNFFKIIRKNPELKYKTKKQSKKFDTFKLLYIFASNLNIYT